MDIYEVNKKRWDLTIAITALVPVVVALIRAFFEARETEKRYRQETR